jgi:glutamate N-acetyltransferase/amino-acid N-acetyltransferase
MSVTAAEGFVASGVSAGIKKSGDADLALVATEDGRPVAAAAVFTQNKATAAPVQVSKRHLEATAGRAAAVILNSGNANAATGQAGLDTARRACVAVANELGCNEEDVLVCSTGLIGIPLDASLIEAAAPALAAARSRHGADDAAQAILTTDTRDKQIVVVRDGFAVGGMAKGAAMLAPNMATMLAVVTTDARVDPVALRAALGNAVDRSFHRLSVDGCTSTNDTVIVLASGAAGDVDMAAFNDSLEQVCLSLATQMADDAEGATKVVRVEVTGAADDSQAAIGARAIAESQLTKCSWYGCDPYWGRIASDLGASGIAFDLDRLSVSYGDHQVAAEGHAIAHNHHAVAEYMKTRHIEITADLGLGNGAWWMLTNDLTHAYVDENMGTS